VCGEEKGQTVLEKGLTPLAPKSECFKAYQPVQFSDIPSIDAWNEGLRHDRIMEQVLVMPGITEKWESEEVEKVALGLLEKV